MRAAASALAARVPVRTQSAEAEGIACGHAIYCELCTIRAVQASGLLGLKCGVCRCAVLQLVVVPVNPAGDPPLLRSMQTYFLHQPEPEPVGSAFEILRDRRLDLI